MPAKHARPAGCKILFIPEYNRDAAFPSMRVYSHVPDPCRSVSISLTRRNPAVPGFSFSIPPGSPHQGGAAYLFAISGQICTILALTNPYEYGK